jgi:hypothetical protein
MVDNVLLGHMLTRTAIGVAASSDNFLMPVIVARWQVIPDRRKTQRLRPLFQFSKVATLKSNTRKTHEIEAGKKQVSN